MCAWMCSPPLPSVADQFELAVRYASTHHEVMPSDAVMDSNLHWYRLNLDLPEESYQPLQVGGGGVGNIYCSLSHFLWSVVVGVYNVICDVM